MMATSIALFVVTAVWYVALIVNLHQIRYFAGMRFGWTATLGIAPFVSLALSALLTEYQVHSDYQQRRLALAALAAGLSPWLCWITALWLDIN